LILKLISDSRERTLETGRLIGESLERGDIVALIGELGSGKTCLTQGMAKGLGVADNVPVVSPTFTLINEYPGKIPSLSPGCLPAFGNPGPGGHGLRGVF
jgi:tRNA threonylcarbamoyladenosine biosynthesis protein TsaE